MWLNIPGLIFIVTFCCLDGLVIFAVYADCDLKESKKVSSNDQVQTINVGKLIQFRAKFPEREICDFMIYLFARWVRACICNNLTFLLSVHVNQIHSFA